MTNTFTTSAAATLVIIAIMIGLFSLLDGLTASPVHEAMHSQIALSGATQSVR